VRSLIQGGQGALEIVGNGDVHATGSTLRGGIRRTGSGDFHDDGSNTVE